MNTLTTNIIRNVYNIGTNACSDGPGYCAEGYALYFPCLKDITKGQDVCFDFYVVDFAGKNAKDIAAALDPNTDTGSGKELADLRDVDALSLNLIGVFNCPYGTYSYPDNISSLQTENYPLMYSEDFGKRCLCHLDVIKIDSKSDASDFGEGKSADFYSGTEVRLRAEDTPTHIFKGWAILDDEDEDCPEETWDDYIKSYDRDYNFIIETDMIVFAVYRPREVYSVISSTTNRHSYFIVTYNNITYLAVSNRPDEGYDDGYDVIENVLEGYHMFVKCIPCEDILGSDLDEMYVFLKWIDGVTQRCRCFEIGKDTSNFTSKNSNVIKLQAVCDDTPVDPYELIDDGSGCVYDDIFDEEGVHILNVEESEDDVERFCDYQGDEYVVSFDNVLQQFIEETGYLYFNNGTLRLTSLDVEDGIKVVVQAKAYNDEDDCDMTVTVNGYSSTVSLVNDEFKQYEFLFRKCDKQNIVITTDGECLVDLIEVRREEIVDKGKARFCLPSEVTANIPSGKLSVNGAIMVNGKSYGIPTTQIGTVNKLPKITIN